MKKLFTIGLACISLSGYAVTLYVIPNGAQRDTTLVLPDFGDRALIEKRGILSVTPLISGAAIELNNDNQQVVNQGLIILTGTGIGIGNGGTENLSIINDGQIFTDGLGVAIAIIGANDFEITNNGRLDTVGTFGIGIQVDTDTNGIITNNGLINALNDGIIARFSTNILLVNNGKINVSGLPTYNGITIGFNVNDIVINNGSIATPGNFSHGIFGAQDTNLIITNTGQILATGVISSNGISLEDIDGIIITNSGTILSKYGNAIQVTNGSSPLLYLLRGSNLQGGVEFTGQPAILAVERGLNLALTLTPTSLDFGSYEIDAPFVVRGNTVAVLDPTGIGLQADVVADFSDTILDNIYRHRTAFACSCNPHCFEVWVEGIGSYRKRSHLKNIGYRNSQGGFIIGVNNPLCFGDLGVFGGASFARAEVDQNTQRADINDYFGGLSFEKIWCQNFIGLAIAVGYVDFCNSRDVMYNLVEGGVQEAKFDTGGAFVSPEFTFAHYFGWNCFSPIVSFTCRYAGCFLGNYREHGSLTNLSVRDRNLNLLTTRLEVSVPFTDSVCNCCWSVEPYLGVFGRFQLSGKNVHGQFFEQPISFDVGNPQNLGALLLGCRGIQSFGRCNLFLNFEVSFDNEKSSRLLGEGGIGYHF